MFEKLWDALLGKPLEWLKESTYWAAVQPFVVLLCAFVVTEVLAYEYVQWQYRISPPLALFLGSYITKRVILVFVALAAILISWRIRSKGSGESKLDKVRQYYKANRGILLFRFCILSLVLLLVAFGFHHYSPRRASQIRIKFMEPPPPAFKQNAFAYLIYELNRQQKHWFFDVDFEPFNQASLKSTQQKKCDEDERPILCYAEEEAQGKPLIGVTWRSLERSYFAVHREKVSVISAFDQKAYAPLTDYEYLMHCVIVQSILIHLDAQCGGLPENAFRHSDISRGGVFEFNPRKEAIKSVILAARLSPEEEELLFNCFGPEYMAACSDLLSLDWLHTARITENLKAHFGITAIVAHPKSEPAVEK